jgi:hypothetical protein
MIVNLTELREAKTNGSWSVVAAARLVDAVLDAPKEWRCARGSAGRPDVCSLVNHHGDCGWVVLVPVEGGET